MIFEADDLVKYYGGSERLVVNLSTSRGEILANQTVYVYINGVNYTRTTNENGTLSMAINLNPGEYDAIITYNNQTSRYAPVDSHVNVTVLHTIYSDNLVKTYHNGTQFWAYLTDSEGNALVNTTVTYNINGVFYNRTTNASGWARLNINLNPGNYIITTYNPVTGEERSNLVKVLSSVVGYDVFKVQGNGSQYHAYFTDFEGKALVNTTVRFNINGVYYTRVTNATGWAILNINLAPGEYTITAYNTVTGEMCSNHVTVFSRFIDNKDIVKKVGTDTPFSVRVRGDNGQPVGAGEAVTFNINGVVYTRYTDANGYAKLNINLGPGKYTITSCYEGFMASNMVTVIE